MMCSSRVELISSIIAASEVDLPEPVGPVTSTKPRGLRVNSCTTAGSPSSSIVEQAERDQAEGGADRAALVVGVDTEARMAGDRVGEVELPVGLQALALVAGEDRVDDLARVGGGQSRVLVERRQPPPHAHGRVRAAAQMQVGGAASDDLHQQVSEIDVHSAAHRPPAAQPRRSAHLRTGRMFGSPALGRALAARRGSHDLERRPASRPQLEASAPWATSTSSPSSVRAPARSRGREQLGRPVRAVDEVDDVGDSSPSSDGVRPSCASAPVPALAPASRPTDVQLTSSRPARAAAPRARRARARALRALGRAVPDRHLARARLGSAQTAARALPPAPSTSARSPRGEPAERRDQAGRVGVLGRDRPVGGERERVRGADRARGLAGAGRRARAPPACAGS